MPLTKREYAGIHPFPKKGQKVVLVVAPERADNRLSTLYNLAENNTIAIKENVVKNGVVYLNSVMQEGLVLTPALVDTTRLVVAGKSKEDLTSLLDTYKTNAIICLENYLITKETSQEKVGDTVKTVIHDWIRVHWSIVSREGSLRVTDTITSNMKVVGSGISSNIMGVDFKSKQHSGLIKYNSRDLYQKLFPWEDEVYRNYYLRDRKPLREAKKLLRNGEIDAAMKLIKEQIDISTKILSKIDPENPKK